MIEIKEDCIVDWQVIHAGNETGETETADGMTGPGKEHDGMPSLIKSLREEIEASAGACSQKTTTNRKTAVNILERCFNDSFENPESITVGNFSQRHIKTLRQWFKENSLSDNYLVTTIANIRPLVKSIVGNSKANELFECVNVKARPTAREYTDENVIKALWNLAYGKDMSGTRLKPKERAALLVTLFQFLAGGLPLCDAARLRKDQPKEGHITIFRKKTNVRKTIPVLTAMQRIIDELSSEDSLYLLPIVTSENRREADRQYRNYLQQHNRTLRKLAARLGSGHKLTSYSMRYAWPNIAREKGESMQLIQYGMMHNSSKTTQRYLSPIRQDLVDQMASRVSNFLYK